MQKFSEGYGKLAKLSTYDTVLIWDQVKNMTYVLEKWKARSPGIFPHQLPSFSRKDKKSKESLLFMIQTRQRGQGERKG